MHNMLQIHVTFMLIGVMCLGAGAPQQNCGKMKPTIGVKHSGGAKYAVAVFNRSSKEISLGDMNSALGFDQFLVNVKTPDGNIAIRRNVLVFTVDTRNAVVISSGSYHEFQIDLSDGTWNYGEHNAKNDQESWKSIKVFYQPQACALKEERKQKAILETKLESMWVDIGAANKK